ncbi:type II secretion system protein [Anaerovorax odorimutans]|uniref:type II secretion system protein n=1 Tax=Anaerovorax odorimutans TaxID=109327 RepID=UPI0004064A9C|nr:type II secretion system protein [Anaerovorax odorimutans]
MNQLTKKQNIIEIKSKKGFTLIELIVVIAILGILAFSAIAIFPKFISEAKKAADETTLKTLDSVTACYGLDEGISGSAIFGNLSDSDKLNQLVEKGLLSSVPTPQQSKANFIFNEDTGKWNLSFSEQEQTTLFAEALKNNSILSSEDLLSKDITWKFGSSSNYDTASWSGYLEKILEKGEGDNKRISENDGKNTINYYNPLSKKTSIFNWNNWDSIKNSSDYKKYLPPAIIITNYKNLEPNNSYIKENIDTLKGAIVIYKDDLDSIDKGVIYNIKEDGSVTAPKKLIDVIN